MRATRRNVLVILGVLTIAGGALFGTGAFTQVSAERTVDVNTAGDDSAQVGMNVTGDIAGSDGQTIAFEENNINLNATTRYDGSFTITNNGDSSFTVDIQDPSDTSLVGSGQTMYFEHSASDLTLDPDESVTFDIVFDTTGTTQTSNVDIPGSITVVAS